MKLTAEEIKELFKGYKEVSDNWLKANKPQPLKKFSEYEHKDVWGNSYTNSIIYMEELAKLKNNFNGIKEMALAHQTEQSHRVKDTLIDKLLVEVEQASWSIEEHLKTARIRIDFFKTLSYVIGNFTWGMG